MKFVFLSFLFLIHNKSFGFPEMVRHHYANCFACHVSTTGGGLLNSYGRTISKEVLSAWGKADEERAWYNVDPEKTGQWLNLGGDFRVLQVHQENENVRKGAFIWMEGNIQLAITSGDNTGFVSIGKPNRVTRSIEPIPTKYFIQHRFSDEISVRVGRMVPSYGLVIPQHNFQIKQNLGFGANAERDILDLQWNGEFWSFMIELSNAISTSSGINNEQAFHFKTQYFADDKYKIGGDYWYGESSTFKRFVVGGHAVMGWSESSYSLFEIDHSWQKDVTTEIEEKSWAQLFKTGYEVAKGFHFQGVQEFSTNSISDLKTIGLGAIWYPRPHFEIETLYSKRELTTTEVSNEDYIYLMAHFYL